METSKEEKMYRYNSRDATRNSTEVDGRKDYMYKQKGADSSRRQLEPVLGIRIRMFLDSRIRIH
jgi:hypothetical protein